MHWAQALVFCGCLMGASIYDVRHRLVDDRVCVALVLAGLMVISPAKAIAMQTISLTVLDLRSSTEA